MPVNSIFKQAFFKTGFAFEYAMESLEEGSKLKREDEIVIYAKINNFDGLKKASSKESHEQWQVPAPFGKIRVRKTSSGDLDGSYTQAIKTRDSQVGIAGGTEQEFPVDANVFEAFKTIADNGMIKDRYVFDASSITALDSTGKDRIDTSGMKYEVDVYPDGKGGYHPWCKIDVEVNTLLDSVADVKGSNAKIKLSFDVSILPFKPTEMILGSTQDTEEKAKISNLYDTYFLAKKDKAGNVVQTAGEVEVIPEGTEEVVDTPVDAGQPTDGVPEEVLDTDTPTPIESTDEVVEPVDDIVDTPQEDTAVVPDESTPTPVVDEVIDTPIVDEVVEPTTDEVVETTEPVEEVVPPSIEEQNKSTLEPYIENLKGKSFEGKRSGYDITFQDEEGNNHKLKSTWGVRGTNVVIDVKFDDEGEFTESVRKNEEGKVMKAED